MLKEYLTNIANAIRSKLGTADKINAQDYADKVNEVYDKGRNDEWSDFWDYYQVKGTRREYSYAFSLGWNHSTFYPKYDIKPVGNRQVNMFYCFGKSPNSYYISDKFDLAERLEECGVVLDTSQATALNWCFCETVFTRIPEISTVSTPSIEQLFYSLPYLETIDKVIFKSDGSQTIGSTAFYNLPELKNIVFEGVVGGNLYMRYSPKLTHESLMSIINALKDYSTSGTVRNLYIGSDNIAKLSEDEKDIITKKGWTFA